LEVTVSEIRLITSSDEHLADLAPGFRKDDYRGSILKKLEWQGDLAKRYKANALLRGGDFFHVKAANKTTYATATAAAEIHQKYSCPTYAIAGNHDMAYNDPQTVSRQPLGLMLESGIFKPMKDVTFEEGTMRVRVVGVEYTTDLDVDGLHEMVKKRDGDTYTVAFVHALAAMAPEEKLQSFFHEKVFDYRDLVFDGCPDAYVFGHYHKDQGIVDHLGVKFVNLGAISRGALTFENMERQPKVSLIKCDSRGIHIEEHVVPHEDASKVFDLEKKKKLDKERRSLDDFIAQFRASAKLSGDESLDEKKATLSQFPDDLRDLVLTTLEAAEAGTLES
jgi:DNA repair exonuclease SbcCD nuclease subunit